MDQLHKMFMDTLSNEVNYANLVTDLIVRKAKAQGVRISEKQQENIRKQLEDGADNVTYDVQTWKWWKKKDVDIQLTQQDLDDLESHVTDLVERIPTIFQEMLEEAATITLDQLKVAWPEEDKRQRRELAGFHDRLRAKWRPLLDRLGMILRIASEVGAFVNDDCRANPDPEMVNQINVITRLHARACQVASEIVTLLSQGFADGAIARWRTLHEIVVVASLIKNHDEDLALRYTLHEAIESHKATRLYQDKCERLGFSPMTRQEIEASQSNYNALIEEHGRPFSTSYGWAAEVLDNPQPTLADLEAAVELDHLRPYYKLASHNVHANPKGVFFKLGLLKEEVLLVGGSDAGMDDPAQTCAISLAQITGTLLKLKTTTDILVALKVMLALSDEIGEAILAAKNDAE